MRRHQILVGAEHCGQPGSDPPFGEGVGHGCPDWCLEDVEGFCQEDQPTKGQTRLRFVRLQGRSTFPLVKPHKRIFGPHTNAPGPRFTVRWRMASYSVHPQRHGPPTGHQPASDVLN